MCLIQYILYCLGSTGQSSESTTPIIASVVVMLLLIVVAIIIAIVVIIFVVRWGHKTDGYMLICHNVI